MTEIPKAGDNSNAQLKAIVERIENVERDMRDRQEDRKEIYIEAKSNGWDVPALKAVIRRRRQDRQKLEAHEHMVETYSEALG